MEIIHGWEEKVESKEEVKIKPKARKDKIIQNFGELIKDYQKQGHAVRESIEKAYSEMYGSRETRKEKVKINHRKCKSDTYLKKY